MSTKNLVAQAESNKDGSASCKRTDHSLLTITQAENDGQHTIIERTHIYASGGREGGFFTEDIR